VTDGASVPQGAVEARAVAARALAAGHVVAIPTDTVYGLAADPTRRGATAALFALDSPARVSEFIDRLARQLAQGAGAAGGTER